MIKYFINRLHHYFSPHESNNFRAKALHNSTIVMYIIALFLFQSSIKFIPAISPNVLGFATDISIERILTRINQKRSEANLPSLVLTNELSQAATQKASDMFAKNYWAHVSPTGTTPWEFIVKSGYEYVYAGENLAKDFNTSDEVVDAWMNSPTHRANILKSEYTDIGLAVMNGTLNGQKTTLIVQEFGSRAKTAVASNGQQQNLPIPTQSIASANEKNQEGTSQNSPKSQDVAMKVSSRQLPFFPLSISKTISLAVAEFLLVVLFIDSIYIWKNKTARLLGHSFAHLLFLGALIGAMGATGIGVIL